MKELFTILKEVIVMAPASIKSDYAALKNFMGVKDTKIKNSTIKRSAI